MKKRLLWLSLTSLLIAVGFYGSAFAADVASFVVQLSPTSATINQAVDLTIKAIDANGNVVQDYAGDVYIDISSVSTQLQSQDYSLPSDGIYTFVASDQ